MYKDIAKNIKQFEINYPNISTKQFYDFDKFFKNYIEPNIDYSVFNTKNLGEFKDFLINICHFDPNKRASLKELLIHPFLSEQTNP